MIEYLFFLLRSNQTKMMNSQSSFFPERVSEMPLRFPMQVSFSLVSVTIEHCGLASILERVELPWG